MNGRTPFRLFQRVQHDQHWETPPVSAVRGFPHERNSNFNWISWKSVHVSIHWFIKKLLAELISSQEPLNYCRGGGSNKMAESKEEQSNLRWKEIMEIWISLHVKLKNIIISSSLWTDLFWYAAIVLFHFIWCILLFSMQLFLMFNSIYYEVKTS